MDIVGGVRLTDGTRGQDRHRRRRPLPVLRVGLRGGPGHGPADLRRPGPGHAPPRGARPGPHRQRQGLHRPLRPRHRRGALRPHLQGERDPPPAHRPPLADHHGQGGALPQDPAGRVPHRQGLRLHRGGPGRPRRLGDRTTTPSGPHQSIGMVAPIERFRLADRPSPSRRRPACAGRPPSPRPPPGRRHPPGRGQRARSASPPPATRPGCGWPARTSPSSATAASCSSTTGACSSPPTPAATTVDKQAAGLRRGDPAKAAARRPTPTAASVTRKVDSSGNVCFAGTTYRAGSQYRRRQVQVAVVGDMVEISIGNELIRCYPVKHDRTREHGALANPGGRPRRINAA